MGELGEMPHMELLLWQAFYQVEPFGPDRQDVPIALAGAAIARSMGSTIKPEDLLPKWSNEQPKGKITCADLKAWADAYNKAKLNRS